MILYLFSGLGADERTYFKINFKDYEIRHIQWISSEKNESIHNYAKRLSVQIEKIPCIFIGLSFGGIMTVEMTNYVNPDKIILISSVKSSKELPYY